MTRAGQAFLEGSIAWLTDTHQGRPLLIALHAGTWHDQFLATFRADRVWQRAAT